jgi:dihydropteroate synthase
MAGIEGNRLLSPRASFFRPVRTWRIAGRTHRLGERTWVMGVLNVTPDSFSDGGRFLDPGVAVAHAHEMVRQGADILDVGGESTRPGSDPVPAEEQWRRIGPVLRQLVRDRIPCLLSVDTQDPVVTGRALELGVQIVNDVSGLRSHPELARLAAEAGAGLVVMHMKGRPKTMQQEARYDDLLGEIRRFLEEALARAADQGLDPEAVVVDPGIGFGKTVAHNLKLISGLPMLDLGRPILVGASRKSFIGAVLDLPVEQRLEGSLAAHVAAVLAGAHVVRAHDVGPTVRATRLADAILREATA